LNGKKDLKPNQLAESQVDFFYMLPSDDLGGCIAGEMQAGCVMGLGAEDVGARPFRMPGMLQLLPAFDNAHMNIDILSLRLETKQNLAELY